MQSIVTFYPGISSFSGQMAECQHHLIGGSYRHLADEDGLIIPLTHKEHNMSGNGYVHQIHGNPAAEKLSKMLGQAAWESEYIADKLAILSYTETKEIRQEARDKFRERYGNSWL